MVLTIAYASTAAGDPHRLSAQTIGRIASDIRTRLFGVQPRPVNVAALIARTTRLVVNGKPITLSWGLDRPIHDENGQVFARSPWRSAFARTIPNCPTP